MALINLLPWREESRQEKKKEFLTLLVVILVLAGIAGYSWFKVVDIQINTQEGRNLLLTQGIQVLDRELKEITELKAKRRLWLERMEVIQGLQGNRAEIVKLFDELARAVPDGVFFSDVNRKGDLISLAGFAESTIRVSLLMRQLDQSPKFIEAGLKNMEADETLGDQGRRFEMSVKIFKPATLVEGESVKEG